MLPGPDMPHDPLKPRPDQVNRRERLDLGEGCAWLIALVLGAVVGGSAGHFLFKNNFYDTEGEYAPEIALKYALSGAGIVAGLIVLAFVAETLKRGLTGRRKGEPE